MQDEKTFYGQCNEFEYSHDFVILLKNKYIYINMYIKNIYMYMCESIFIVWSE